MLETDGDWAFGQAARDGYVGWAGREGLSPALTPPSHWIRAPGACVMVEPRFKAPPLARLSMNALVSIDKDQNGFAKAAGSGWIAQAHLAPLGDWERDPACVADLGVDSSGLIQQALYACGLACPRDSDLQQGLGLSFDPGPRREFLRRNDLVFWKGHVGIMLDEARLLHATSHRMAVTLEPLTEVVRRKGPPTAFRRLA